MHKTKFLPFAGVYNIRCLFVRNVIHDTTFGKRDQYIINLFAGQSGTYGQGCFADIGIVGEYSGVRAENRLYQCFGFRVNIFSALSTGTGKYLNFRQNSSRLNSRTHWKPSPIAI